MSLYSMFESYCVLQRPTVGQDAVDGTTSDPFVDESCRVACSYQEGGASDTEVFGQRNTSVSATLSVAQDMGAEVNDRILVTTPRTCESFYVLVVGQTQPVARGRFYSISVTRIREPQ